jgi:hypothetical protein
MTHYATQRLATSRLIGLAGMLLALGACAKYEPFERVGTWRAEGSNQANLATMAANPVDLVQGRSDNSPRYRQPGAAVTNLWANKPIQGLLPGLKGGGEVTAGSGPATAPAPAATP